MTWFVRSFLKASLSWLALGVSLGVAMAAHPLWTVYRLVHVHMVLLGFVTMMIYGVAYHVIPRFAGFPLYSARAAVWHWWISNAGLALMATGFAIRVHEATAGTIVLATGGTLSALGAYTFVYVIWRTIDGPASLRDGARRAQQAVQQSRDGTLPVMGARPPVPDATAARR
jgi:cbb3-type cytochrome oxidase subunit 1